MNMTEKLINKMNTTNSLILQPNIDDNKLTKKVSGINELNEPIDIDVVTEKPLTIYLNSQEIVTTMTLGDMPKELSVGYLLNQNMINRKDVIEEIDYDEDIDVVIVRTKRKTNYEKKLSKKIRTSGCAVGTVYGDMMEIFYDIKLNDETKIKSSWMRKISKNIIEVPSLYLKAGAIHGCALCLNDNILAYVEDVGRHNAVDKIAGWMFLNNIEGNDKIFYTTGRLTSEMIIKTVQMEIPILLSRSGFTESGVNLANEANLSLIGRMKGKRFILLSGSHRVIYD
ncbi:MAG: formate dehydrogenase accessory sulfurtransferase FdhD [Candidatus Puniceispirillales bacterium]